jgi:UDP-glucose 4-epimerase
MKINKVLITGGAGFIGSHLANNLIEMGHEVVIVDNLSSGSKENIPVAATFYKIDLKNCLEINEIFKIEKPNMVSHHAAQTKVRDSLRNPKKDAQNNILGTINLMQALKKTNVRKVVYASSGGAVYGNVGPLPHSEKNLPKPISYYGASKLSAENYIRISCAQLGISYSILRYSNVYGPRQREDGFGGVVPIFIKSLLLKKRPTIYGDGQQTRDFVYIDDVIRANVKAMNSDKSDVFNVGTGQETSINNLFKMINLKLDASATIKYAPKVRGEIKRSVVAIDKIKAELRWKPTHQLDQGLDKNILWQRQLYSRHI